MEEGEGRSRIKKSRRRRIRGCVLWRAHKSQRNCAKREEKDEREKEEKRKYGLRINKKGI